MAALAILAACSGPTPEAPPPEPVALVTLAPATAGAVAARVTLYGQVEAGPGSDRTLAAPVEATVASIDTPVGARVARGQVVVRLQDSAQSAFDLAKAANDSASAAATLARARRLRADGLMSDADVETARAAARTASATRASLAARTGGLALAAPVAGLVSAVLPKPGDLVAAGAPVARITVAGGATRARLGIDPALATTIAPGAPLELRALGGTATRTLSVAGVDHTVDPATRLAALFADVPSGLGFAIGQSVQATLIQPRARGGVTIPYAAVLDDGGAPYVFVVHGGVAKKRDVTLGSQDGARVLVLGGVGAGEAVVIAGGTAVEDGMKVRTR